MRSAARLALVLLYAVSTADAGEAFDAPSGGFDWYGPQRSNVDSAAPTSVFTNVSVEGPIEDLDFGVSLLGGYADNLRLTLIHGDVSAVIYQGGGDTSNAFVDVLFDDEDDSDYSPTGQIEGSYRPAPGALSAFDGVELSGLWELRIENGVGLPGDGTDLGLFRLTGRVGLAGPPIVVALYDDPAFVDSVELDGESEAENLYAALVEFGHDVRRFEGTSAASFAAALAGAHVLVFPELEEGDLAAALDVAARETIGAFVDAGGRLVACYGDSFTTDLVNAILGTSLAPGGEVTGPLWITNQAQGTPFQGGPGELPPHDATNGFSELPNDARYAYANGNLYGVVEIPFGSGDAYLLGWDFYDARPLGSQDGGWLETLHRAVLGERAVPSRRAAFFADGDFVDDQEGQESETLQANLALLGHDVLLFAGTSESRFREQLAGVSLLVMPEFENGSLAAAMTPPARQVVADFVAGGGVMVKAGGASTNDIDFLNATFGFGVTLGMSYSGAEGASAILSGGAAGTTFAGGPVPFLTYSRTTGLANLPPGARSLYRASDGNAPNLVVELPYGAGKVIWLGWDWHDAAPLGPVDSVWSEVLHRAVVAAPEPGGPALGLAALVALAALRRRRGRA